MSQLVNGAARLRQHAIAASSFDSDSSVTDQQQQPQHLVSLSHSHSNSHVHGLMNGHKDRDSHAEDERNGLLSGGVKLRGGGGGSLWHYATPVNVALLYLSLAVTWLLFRALSSSASSSSSSSGAWLSDGVLSPLSAAAGGSSTGQQQCQAPTLTVVIPHFMNLEVSPVSLRAMVMRQSRQHCVRYMVLSEELTNEERVEVHVKLTEAMHSTLKSLPSPNSATDCFCTPLATPGLSPSSSSSSSSWFSSSSSSSSSAGSVANLAGWRDPVDRTEVAHRSALRSAAVHSLFASINTTGAPFHLPAAASFPMEPLMAGSVWLDFFPFPMSEVGGGSLQRLHQVANLIGATTGAEFMVLSDTDAIILADSWDRTLITNLQRTGSSGAGGAAGSTVLAAINPRKGVFEENAEWNFLSFRYSFFRPYLNSLYQIQYGDPFYDVGHWWSYQVRQAGMAQHLFTHTHTPLPGRSPSIVGDAANPAFALHFFYSSRRHKDNVPLEELNYICTPEEYDGLLKLALQPNLTLQQMQAWTTDWLAKHPTK